MLKGASMKRLMFVVLMFLAVGVYADDFYTSISTTTFCRDIPLCAWCGKELLDRDSQELEYPYFEQGKRMKITITHMPKYYIGDMVFHEKCLDEFYQKLINIAKDYDKDEKKNKRSVK
jgi:hypothetical protein